MLKLAFFSITFLITSAHSQMGIDYSPLAPVDVHPPQDLACFGENQTHRILVVRENGQLMAYYASLKKSYITSDTIEEFGQIYFYDDPRTMDVYDTVYRANSADLNYLFVIETPQKNEMQTAAFYEVTSPTSTGRFISLVCQPDQSWIKIWKGILFNFVK